MKKFLLLIICVLAFSITKTSAGEFGLGIILGEPTGISGKLLLDKNIGIDTALSYSFRNYFHIHGDFLWHFPGFLSKSSQDLRPLIGYLGVGPGVRISSKHKPQSGDDRTHFYARFPFGLEWRFDHPRLGLFIEVAPGMALAPEVFGLVQGGLGLRYYF